MTDTSRIPFVETMLGISILEERLGPITAGAALLCNDGSFSLLFGRPIRLPEIVRCRRRDNVIEASAIEVVDLERDRKVSELRTLLATLPEARGLTPTADNLDVFFLQIQNRIRLLREALSLVVDPYVRLILLYELNFVIRQEHHLISMQGPQIISEGRSQDLSQRS